MPGKYTYIGQVELAGEPYQEPDADGKPRLVWVFPLRQVRQQNLINKSKEVWDFS